MPKSVDPDDEQAKGAPRPDITTAEGMRELLASLWRVEQGFETAADPRMYYKPGETPPPERARLLKVARILKAITVAGCIPGAEGEAMIAKMEKLACAYLRASPDWIPGPVAWIEGGDVEPDRRRSAEPLMTSAVGVLAWARHTKRALDPTKDLVAQIIARPGAERRELARSLAVAILECLSGPPTDITRELPPLDAELWSAEIVGRVTAAIDASFGHVAHDDDDRAQNAIRAALRVLGHPRPDIFAAERKEHERRIGKR